eukprot:COSAG04_NODE_91_length_26852_cov_8.609315_16_plen_98_part_00
MRTWSPVGETTAKPKTESRDSAGACRHTAKSHEAFAFLVRKHGALKDAFVEKKWPQRFGENRTIMSSKPSITSESGSIRSTDSGRSALSATAIWLDC